MNWEMKLGSLAKIEFFEGDLDCAKDRLLDIDLITRRTALDDLMLKFCRLTLDSYRAEQYVHLGGGLDTLAPNSLVEFALIPGTKSPDTGAVLLDESFLDSYLSRNDITDHDRTVNGRRLRAALIADSPGTLIEKRAPQIEIEESILRSRDLNWTDRGRLLVQALDLGLLTPNRLRTLFERLSYCLSPDAFDLLREALMERPIFYAGQTDMIRECSTRTIATTDDLNRLTSWIEGRASDDEAVQRDLFFVLRSLVRQNEFDRATSLFEMNPTIRWRWPESTALVRKAITERRQFSPSFPLFSTGESAGRIQATLPSEHQSLSERQPTQGRWVDRKDDIANLMRLGDTDTAMLRLLEELQNPTLPDDLLRRSLASFIQLLGKAARFDDVVTLMDNMKAADFRLDAHLYQTAIRSAAPTGNCAKAEEWFGDLLLNGIELTSYMFSSMIHVYSGAYHLDGAIKYLDWAERALGKADPRHHYGPILNACRTRTDSESTTTLLNRMRQNGVRADRHNIADSMRTYLDDHRPKEALDLYHEFCAHGDTPDNHIYELAIASCMSLRRFDEAEQILFLMIEDGLDPDSFHFAQVIDACTNSGKVVEARKWFQTAADRIGVDPYLMASIARTVRRSLDRDLFEFIASEAVGDPTLLTAGAFAELVVSAQELEDETTLRNLVDCMIEFLSRDTTPPEVAERLAMDALHIGEVGLFDRLAIHATRLGTTSTTFKVCEIKRDVLAGNLGHAHQLFSSLTSFADVDTWSLTDLLIVMGDAGFVDSAKSLLRELSTRGSLSTRSIGHLMNCATQQRDPLEVERLLREFLPQTSPTPDQETVLFNILLKAHRLFGTADDFNRIKGEVLEKGLPLDRYFLGTVHNSLRSSGSLGETSQVVGRFDTDGHRELSIILDDVVHELSQMVGEIGVLTRAISSFATIKQTSQQAEVVERLLDVSSRVGDRLRYYGAIASRESFAGDANVMEVVEWAKDQFRSSCDDLGIVFSAHCDIDPMRDSVLVCLSEFYLRMIIKALVTNAFEAVAAAPSDRTPRVWLTITADRGMGSVIIYARDNGPGIPEATRGDIFERGFSTKGGRGLGLGMSLVSRIVDSVGGSVHISENGSEGAEFILTIPNAP